MVGKIILIVRAVRCRIKRLFMRRLFGSYGRNFIFCPDDTFSYETIHVGEDVYIGQGACFRAARTTLTIGNKVMFGPGVTIMGGDHNTSVVGKYMANVRDKRPEDDQPVVIEDDVWVGCNATILKGVTISRGSIIAAGAVVTKSIPAYSIAGGVPAKVIRRRWSTEEILEHEKSLYSEADRLSEAELRGQE